LEERNAEHRDELFAARVGQWPETRTSAPGENHCMHDASAYRRRMGADSGVLQCGRGGGWRVRGGRTRWRRDCRCFLRCCAAVAGDGDGCRWERDDELRAALGVTDRADGAAVGFDDLSGDRQPEAAAAATPGPRPIHLEEALEDAWQIVGGDDGAC